MGRRNPAQGLSELSLRSPGGKTDTDARRHREDIAAERAAWTACEAGSDLVDQREHVREHLVVTGKRAQAHDRPAVV